MKFFSKSNYQLQTKFVVNIFQSIGSIHLCQTCTDSLTSAYIFWQRIKQSDDSVSTIVHAVTEGSPATRPRLDNEIEFIATDDVEIEHYLISNGNKEKTNDDEKIELIVSATTKRTERKSKMNDSAQANESNNRIGVNIALPHFVITNSVGKEDRVHDDGSLDFMDNKVDANKAKPPTKPVKTLIASVIVPNSLAEINELCVSSLQAEDDAESIFQCSHCPKAFAAPYHLMIHMRKSHLCQYCLSTFAKINDLYEHVKEAHASYDCLLCSREFQSNGNLRQHMRKNHSIFLPAYISLLNLDEIN